MGRKKDSHSRYIPTVFKECNAGQALSAWIAQEEERDRLTQESAG
ncbi:hypothetical protein [Marinobacterium ramblicola]|nr:hypothetical protein [Marinobacterium ramblicola]